MSADKKMDKEKYLYVPISLLFVTLSENHEQISFSYPFEDTVRVPSNEDALSPDALDRLECISPERKRQMNEMHGLKPEILAHLLSAKGATDLPFELEIDNMRYTGYPKMVSKPKGRSPRTFNVIFAVSAEMPSDLVMSYKELSASKSSSCCSSHVCVCLIGVSTPLLATKKLISVEHCGLAITLSLQSSDEFLSGFCEWFNGQKIAVAIDSEQTRCNYLHKHMSIMLDAHDKLERQQTLTSQQPSNYEAECFREILVKSSLASDLCNIFNDLSDHGLVSVFLNDVVEIGFCLLERCMVRAGLAPKKNKQVEAQISCIRPYHAIHLLEGTIPGPDASSDLQRIKEFCTPDRSILEISNTSGLATMQVFLIVRHLLLWGRAILIYPICRENLYSSCAYPQLSLQKYAERFQNMFREDLAVVLAQFSPSCTLDEFLDPTVYSETDQSTRYNMLVFFLRYNLVVQLHTFIYLLEPLSGKPPDETAYSQLRQEREIIEIIDGSGLSDTFKAHVAEICTSLLATVHKEQLLDNLKLFVSMVPLLNGEHHVEDIMFRLNKDRLVVTRVLELFATVLCSFERPDFIHNQFT